MRVALAGLALVLALAAAAYRPGLAGPFLFDDAHNVVDNPRVAVAALTPAAIRDAAYSGNNRWPDRALARVSFAASYRLAGGAFDPRAFKLGNLAVHLVNGVLAWALATVLVGRWTRAAGAGAGRDAAAARIAALAAAAIWVLHPLQLTSVLYVVQRMTSMSATFVLAGALLFALGRARLESGRGGAFALMSAGVAGGAALGGLCKENAALVPFLALLVEVACFRRDGLGRGARRGLAAFFVLLATLPALAVLAALALEPQALLADYARRPFGPLERLLSEARILLVYAGLWLVPDPGRLGLFHDDIAVSTGLLEPWTTAPALAAWALLVVLAARAAPRGRPWAFAVLWFLVGHAMESTLIPLELAHEHRNYLPTFGPALAAGWYLAAIGARSGRPRWTGAAAAAAIALVLAFVTFARAGIWADERTLLAAAVRDHPASARSHASYARLLGRETVDPMPVYEHWRHAARLDPASVAPLVAMAQIAAAVAAKRGEAPAAAPGAAPDPLAAPLAGDPAYLAALGAAIDRAVRRRLAAPRLPWGAVGALRDLQRCVTASVPGCAALAPRAAAWLDRALDNPVLADAERATALLAQAKLRAYAGDVETAAALAERAAARDPGQAHYRLELAALHAARGDLDAARAALDAARAVRGPGRAPAAAIDAVEARIARGR